MGTSLVLPLPQTLPPDPRGSVAQGMRSDRPTAGWPPQHLQLGPTSERSPSCLCGRARLPKTTHWSFLGSHSPSSGQCAAFNLPALTRHTEGLLAGSAAFTVAREDSRPQIWASSLPDTSPGTLLPRGQRLVLPSTPQSKSFQEQAPRPAPPRGPLTAAVTLGNCSAGPTTSRIVGLFSLASALPSCFPKKLGIGPPGVLVTSLSLSSLEPWHPAPGKKLDRNCHSICIIAACSGGGGCSLGKVTAAPGAVGCGALGMQGPAPAFSTVRALLSCLA